MGVWTNEILCDFRPYCPVVRIYLHIDSDLAESEFSWYPGGSIIWMAVASNEASMRLCDLPGLVEGSKELVQRNKRWSSENFFLRFCFIL